MNYVFDLGSGAMIYTQSFVKTGSAIQKPIGGDSRTQRETERERERKVML
jgi:hypothetical protein